MKVFFRILLLISFLFTSFQVSHAWLSDFFEESQPQVHYCKDGKGTDCGLKEGIQALDGSIEDIITDRSFSVYAQDIVEFLLWFIYLVAIAFIIYAWFNLITGAGDEEKAKKSKGMIVYVFIWILIIFLAGPIADFILNILNSTS